MIERQLTTPFDSSRSSTKRCHTSHKYMDIKAYNDHCLVQEEVTEQLRFDEKMLVYNGKRLTVAHIDIFESIHRKCDPAKAIQLREAYAAPLAGHHMHKDHWDAIRQL